MHANQASSISPGVRCLSLGETPPVPTPISSMWLKNPTPCGKMYNRLYIGLLILMSTFYKLETKPVASSRYCRLLILRSHLPCANRRYRQRKTHLLFSSGGSKLFRFGSVLCLLIGWLKNLSNFWLRYFTFIGWLKIFWFGSGLSLLIGWLRTF